jgi:uncharacterized membrane protein YkoI
MISRRSALLAMTLAALTPATAEERDEYGDCRRRSRYRYRHRDLEDHEFARRALQDGRARPLADILAIAKEKIGGEVIGVELEQRAGAMVYELKVLRPNGELVEMQVDALTGAIIKQDDH